MAAIINDRDVLLQAAGTRLLPVQLPSNYSTTGDHQGTLSGQGQTNFQNNQIQLSATGQLLNAGGGLLTSLNNVGGNFLGNWSGHSQTVHRNDQITLSSTGALQNAGGGSITNLDYSNVGGTKPPPTADTTKTILESAATDITINSGSLFNIYGSGSAGVFIGSGGLFGRNSSGSTTFSINASNGSVEYAGDITGGSDIDIVGIARFGGSTSQSGSTYALVANTSANSESGVYGRGTTNGSGVFGFATGIAAAGVEGDAGDSNAVGVRASGGNVALQVFGRMTIDNSTLVSNLRAQTCVTADSANFVSGSNVSGTVANATNASQLGAVAASGWCRGIACDVGTATATGFGFGLVSTVSGVETSASGNNITIRTISDRRKKTDINAEELGLEFVGQLTPVTYRMKDSPTIKHHGFIAQDIEKIIGVGNDALAQTHDDGMKGTDYMSLVGVLVKAIQELNEKVRVLTNEKGLNK